MRLRLRRCSKNSVLGVQHFQKSSRGSGVRRFIAQYQESTISPNMERALGRSRQELEAVRRQLEGDNLPPDLAYMVLVEAPSLAAAPVRLGLHGLWQFTPTTGEAYGLKVGQRN